MPRAMLSCVSASICSRMSCSRSFIMRSRFFITRPPASQIAESVQSNAKTSLLVSKCDQRIDARGTARGDVAGGQRDERQQNPDARESERIVRVHSIEYRGHETREAHRRRNSNGCAYQNQ